ncbi:MAG: AAA family ATPase [Pseudomonas sp.]
MNYLIDLKMAQALPERHDYPFNLAVMHNLRQLTFSTAVTFIAGENGTGKSTLLELLAVGAKSLTISSKSIAQDPTFTGARALAKHFRFSRRSVPRHTLFFRAEDFVRFADKMNVDSDELEEMREYFDNTYSGYGRQLATGMAQGQRAALLDAYGDLHAVSHGEGIFKVFKSRIRPNGLYLIDEPETSLSAQRQLALLALLSEAVQNGSQFIIATHSPLLLAFPGARILQIGEGHLHEVDFDDCDAVTLTRGFLQSPAQYLRYF